MHCISGPVVLFKTCVTMKFVADDHACETCSTININRLSATKKAAQTAHVRKITNHIPDSVVGWTYFRKLESSSMLVTGVVWFRKQTDFLHAPNHQHHHRHPAVYCMISSRPVWGMGKCLTGVKYGESHYVVKLYCRRSTQRSSAVRSRRNPFNKNH